MIKKKSLQTKSAHNSSHLNFDVMQLIKSTGKNIEKHEIIVEVVFWRLGSLAFLGLVQIK